MPRKKFTKRCEGVELSLDELCRHDDVCTDALIDKVGYAAGVQKCKAKYTPMRGIDEISMIKLVHDYMVLAEDEELGLRTFLELDTINKYRMGLDTVVEGERFAQHAITYLRMYLPTCAWEVSSTNRYTVSCHEASVVARCAIQPGPILHLVGTTVAVGDLGTDAQEQRCGMSVMMSAKDGKEHVMLGPARLVNHDCNANAALHVVSGGVQVVATRAIRVDEEITVRYGGDYFGADNCDCLCATCELLVQGGWRPVEQPGSMQQAKPYRDRTRVPSEYLAVRSWLAERHGAQIVHRTPGDYVLTKQLLVCQYDRWTRCSNQQCGLNFVQRDGYQMRLHCPRCERHMIIYGSTWPELARAEEVDKSTLQLTMPAEGRCGKGRWTSEEATAEAWTPRPRASKLYVGTVEAKLVTRQGQQMEADAARLRGEAIDAKFEGGVVTRRSRRLR